MSDRLRAALAAAALIGFLLALAGCQRDTTSDPSQRTQTPQEQKERADKQGK